MYQYQQLAQELKEEILSGNLQKGDKLPSIRELVSRYGVNKDTVQRALRSLKMKVLFMRSKKVAIMY